MNARNNLSDSKSHALVKDTIRELVRMWGRAGVKRTTAFEYVGKSLRIAPRKAKALMYDEEQLPLPQVPEVAAREECAWERLEAQFLDYAEYCKAKRQQAVIRRLQGELDLSKEEKWSGSGLLQKKQCGQWPQLVVG
jgi:hypothetical protein